MTTKAMPMDALQDLSDSALVALLEVQEEDAAAHRRRAEAAKLRGELVRGLLLQRMGDGESIAAPSGRELYRDPAGLLGKAAPSEAALLEAAPRLPEDLRPEPSYRLATVAKIRAAEKEGRLPAGLRADDLLDLPETGAVLRWKTLE